jgi:hypothetical protein
MSNYESKCLQNFSKNWKKYQVRWFRKDILVSSDFSKKRTNKFVFSTVQDVRRRRNPERSRNIVFLRKYTIIIRIWGYQKSFRNYLTFNRLKMYLVNVWSKIIASSNNQTYSIGSSVVQLNTILHFVSQIWIAVIFNILYY